MLKCSIDIKLYVTHPPQKKKGGGGAAYYSSTRIPTVHAIVRPSLESVLHVLHNLYKTPISYYTKVKFTVRKSMSNIVMRNTE